MKKICLFLIAVMVLASTASFAADIVIITNKDNPVSSVSAKDVKNIYLGKMVVWSDGTSIDPYGHKDRDLSNLLVKTYVKKSPQQYFLYWQNAVFTGKGSPPIEVENDEQMKKIVAATKGAVGFISASSLDASVKKLTVN